MSLYKVKEYFREYGIENNIIEFDKSSATVKLAAIALNCPEGKIAKSLTFKVNNEPVMIVTAGDVKIDNSKFKNFFHEKASMLKTDEVEIMIGHTVGGVCPFAVNNQVKIYLDNSLKRFDIVYPACGSSNSAIPLTISELEHYSKYQKWIDVSK